MSVTFNNSPFTGAQASTGLILGAPGFQTYAGTSLTGALGTTAVTIAGTIDRPLTSTVTVDISAAGLTAVGAQGTYLGYTALADGGTEYYFSVNGGGIQTPITLAVASTALSLLAATPVDETVVTAPPSALPSAAAGPVFQNATATGSTVTLNYNEALGTPGPLPASFTVTAGGQADAVTAATVQGNGVALTLATPLTAGQAVAVTYKDPTISDDAAAIQDTLGHDAASLTTSVTATAAAGTTTTLPGGTTISSGGTGGNTTVTTPVGTVTTGTGGTTVTTPVGTVTLPVGVGTGSGGTTITTPVGTVTLPVGVSTGSGGTTITTPLGPVTIPTGGTITLPGTGGGGTTISPSSGGSSTVVTVGPTGAQTTQTIPSGSTIATGVGAAAGDVVSIDPYASFKGRGQFTIGGHVAATSGVKSVTISAVIDGASSATVLGTAAVAADGSYSFNDMVGQHLQGFITATATDGAGGSVAVQSPYSLQAGLRSPGGFQGSFNAEQDLYTPDGSTVVAETSYRQDGSRRVDVQTDGQTFRSDFFDVFNNGGAPNNTFVFQPGHGLDVVNLFRANGADHDTLSFKGSDFGADAASQLAGVLANMKQSGGSTTITDPTSGDTVKLVGITKAELKANTGDFTFHA